MDSKERQYTVYINVILTMQKNLSSLRIRNDILREKSAFFNYCDVVCFMIYLFLKDKRPFYQLYS